MKKILLTTVILLSLLITNTVPLYAQESSLTTDTQYFEISMERVSQSAWNKTVTYTIYVTPKIDSPRTQIIWDAPTLVEINPKHEEFVDLYNGETYSFNTTIKAKQEGSYELSVNLIAWQHDTNYTNSVSDIITFDSNLLAQPIEPSYTYGNIAKILIIVFLSGLGVWGMVVLSKKGFNSFKKWITPPT